MIYTFYSYKGGVGRSMALANIAELFYRANLKVLIVDWDLEAPGIEKFFLGDSNKERHEEFYNNPGIIDMLLLYKQEMSQKTIEFKDINSLDFLDLNKFIFDVYPESKNATTKGKLWILSAGKRPEGYFPDYVNAVINFDWKDFYKNWEGEVYFELLRQQFQNIADVVLIDSRTGVTEMGGVCTYQLADVVVMLCSANNQCLDGTRRMLLNLIRPEVKESRGRELEVVIVPTRLDVSESDRFAKFEKKFNTFFPTIKKELFNQIAIPYVARYSYEEILAVREEDKYVAKILVEPYSQIAVHLSRFADPEKSRIPKLVSENLMESNEEVPNVWYVVDPTRSSSIDNKNLTASWICIGGRDGKEQPHAEYINYSDKCDICGLPKH